MLVESYQDESRRVGRGTCLISNRCRIGIGFQIGFVEGNSFLGQVKHIYSTISHSIVTILVIAYGINLGYLC